jgi:hypothetical protein
VAADGLSVLVEEVVAAVFTFIVVDEAVSWRVLGGDEDEEQEDEEDDHEEVDEGEEDDACGLTAAAAVVEELAGTTGLKADIDVDDDEVRVGGLAFD